MRALTELKKECFNRISGSYCFCCGHNKPKQLTLHHLSYSKNSITYNNFENSDDGRLKYYVCLLDEIKEDASNFIVVCMNCHNIIEDLLKMEWVDAYNWVENNDGNYYEAWNMSFKRRRHNRIGLDYFLK